MNTNATIEDLTQMFEWIEENIMNGKLKKISISLEPMNTNTPKLKIEFEEERPSHELEDK